jgi:hypothetical protein
LKILHCPNILLLGLRKQSRGDLADLANLALLSMCLTFHGDPFLCFGSRERDKKQLLPGRTRARGKIETVETSNASKRGLRFCEHLDYRVLVFYDKINCFSFEAVIKVSEDSIYERMVVAIFRCRLLNSMYEVEGDLNIHLFFYSPRSCYPFLFYLLINIMNEKREGRRT